jgi:hypothetical protein
MGLMEGLLGLNLVPRRSEGPHIVLRGNEEGKKTLGKRQSERRRTLSRKTRRNRVRMRKLIRSFRHHGRIHRQREGLSLLLESR